MRSTWSQYDIWAILLIALILRLVMAFAINQYVAQTPGRLCLIAGDAEGYWELGQRLARGEPYEIYQPPRRILRMPGFPLVLAGGMRLLGEHPERVRMLLALVGTIAVAGTWWLARDLAGRRAGLLAGVLAAISPTFIVTSVMFLSETAFAVGVLLTLIPLVKTIRAVQCAAQIDSSSQNDSEGNTGLLSRVSQSRDSLSRLVLLGLCTGLGSAIACYMRPSWLLFPVATSGLFVILALGVPAAQRSRALQRAMLASLSIGLGLVIGLSPWIVRNYHITGRLIPTTLWMGPSLYDGLNPLANGDSHMEFLQQDDLYQRLSEYDVDQHYRREAWQWAAQNPLRVLELAWVKQLRFWNLWPNARQFDHWAVRILLCGYFVPVLISLAIGLWSRRKIRSDQPIGPVWYLFLTVGPVLYFAALHTLFVSSVRYRIPAEYPLLVLAGSGLDCLMCRWLPRPTLPRPTLPRPTLQSTPEQNPEKESDRRNHGDGSHS